MRIIAGEARGNPIFAPKGQDTRPTQDHVRESLFNILQQVVPDARVLDLFAGSGALAIEALSRGAEAAVLVDRSQDAIACIRRNLEKTRLDDRATVLKCEWQTALNQLAGREFDLVFLDPPYRMTETGEMCARMADTGLLADGAVMVVEHRKESPPAMDARFTLTRERAYGDTVIHFYRYVKGATVDADGTMRLSGQL